MITTSLLNIYKKIINWDKKLAIYKNGEDNNYPERMERLKNNSVTAKMASAIMVQYLIGKGFGEADNLKIGKDKLIHIATDIATDLVDNKGYYVHVNFNANLGISDFKKLPFNQCRIGEKDSNDYNGKILVHKDWSGDVKAKDVKVLNVFNPDKEVLKYQIKAAGGIENFKGQILYFNIDRNYYYPLNRIDTVSHDCNSEYNASVYKDNILENGFIQSTFFITRPLIDNNFIIEARQSKDSVLLENLRNQESERENFKENGKQMLGAKGIGGFMHVEVDFAGDDLSQAFKIETIKSNVDPALFKFVEESAMDKILMVYNNLPNVLIKADNSMFGSSGEALRVAKETYWENTWIERNILETVINDLYKLTEGSDGQYLFIKPLFTKEASKDTVQQENARAQANLKGSVGGVQALLEIQTSVGLGTTDYNAAVAMIVNIYGFDDATAKTLLGTPKITENAIN